MSPGRNVLSASSPARHRPAAPPCAPTRTARGMSGFWIRQVAHHTWCMLRATRYTVHSTCHMVHATLFLISGISHMVYSTWQTVRHMVHGMWFLVLDLSNPKPGHPSGGTELGRAGRGEAGRRGVPEKHSTTYPMVYQKSEEKAPHNILFS